MVAAARCGCWLWWRGRKKGPSSPRPSSPRGRRGRKTKKKKEDDDRDLGGGLTSPGARLAEAPVTARVQRITIVIIDTRGAATAERAFEVAVPTGVTALALGAGQRIDREAWGHRRNLLHRRPGVRRRSQSGTSPREGRCLRR